MSSRSRFLIVLLLAVVIGAACGSRLPDQTLEVIDADLAGAADSGGSSEQTFAAGTGEAPADAAVPAEAPVAGAAPVPVEGATPAPGQPAPAAACRPGSATGPGVTAKEITAASIVTDSGPLPGATEGSYRGAAAYFAMVNSQGGVCGRKLTLVKGDDGLDPARGRGEFLRLEPKVLGFVGGFSVADSGFIDLIGTTKVPFMSQAVDPAGRDQPTVLPRLSDEFVTSGPFVHLKQQNPNVTKAALLYADVGGVSANIDGARNAMEKAGFQLVEPPIAVGVADPDYTGQVRNLQDKGVEFVYLFAFEVNMHVRFNRNMRTQRFDPPIKGSNIAFNNRFSELLGAEGDGWQNDVTYLPFLDPAEKGRSKAVNDFLTWNQRVFPGGQLDLFAVTGWGRAAYFVEALRAAGGDVDRAKLLAAAADIPKFDGGGLSVETDLKSGRPSGCFAMAIHQGGSWKRSHPKGEGFECGLGELVKFK